jgi:hypothetical protein
VIFQEVKSFLKFRIPKRMRKNSLDEYFFIKNTQRDVSLGIKTFKLPWIIKVLGLVYTTVA